MWYALDGSTIMFDKAGPFTGSIPKPGERFHFDNDVWLRTAPGVGCENVVCLTSDKPWRIDRKVFVSDRSIRYIVEAKRRVE